MWQRRTFHECAEELSAISGDFRSAYTNRWGWDRAQRDRVMRDTSTRGVEVLRILALSVRGDQDYGLTNNMAGPVGAFCANATEAEALALARNYHPPYSSLPGFAPLTLRQALNKIAHANPAGSGFFADAETHDLVLTGKDRGSVWIAVISLIDLSSAVKSLPDANTRQ
jgi:hypothetical protein